MHILIHNLVNNTIDYNKHDTIAGTDITAHREEVSNMKVDPTAPKIIQASLIIDMWWLRARDQ